MLFALNALARGYETVISSRHRSMTFPSQDGDGEGFEAQCSKRLRLKLETLHVEELKRLKGTGRASTDGWVDSEGRGRRESNMRLTHVAPHNRHTRRSRPRRVHP